MELTFIGVNSALSFGPKCFNANALLQHNGKGLLIDCGVTASVALANAGKEVKDVDAIYISHLHGDHAGGLEFFAWHSFFSGKRIRLYAVDYMMPQIWNALKESMKVIGPDFKAFYPTKLGTFFDLCPIDYDPERSTNGFVWNEIAFSIFEQKHIVIGSEDDMYSYGLKIPCIGVAITSDTSELFLDDSCTMVFHDCEVTKRMSGVHTHYTELCRLNEARKKERWLYHYQSHVIPDWRADGFAGMVQTGQVFNFG